jgi:hypothetical protein
MRCQGESDCSGFIWETKENEAELKETNKTSENTEPLTPNSVFFEKPVRVNGYSRKGQVIGPFGHFDCLNSKDSNSSKSCILDYPTAGSAGGYCDKKPRCEGYIYNRLDRTATFLTRSAIQHFRKTLNNGQFFYEKQR